jgi:hypothetical protein
MRPFVLKSGIIFKILFLLFSPIFGDSFQCCSYSAAQPAAPGFAPPRVLQAHAAEAAASGATQVQCRLHAPACACTCAWKLRRWREGPGLPGDARARTLAPALAHSPTHPPTHAPRLAAFSCEGSCWQRLAHTHELVRMRMIVAPPLARAHTRTQTHANTWARIGRLTRARQLAC